MKKIIALLALLLFATTANAQTNISMELRDSPIRSSLEMAFKQAGIKNYVIDNSVYGFVSLNLTDQPFETALKIIMRANSVPLLYRKENDVWIVEQRKITTIVSNPAPQILEMSQQSSIMFEKIHLTYIDPFDLQLVLGQILNINQFQRFRGGGMMGGMGGFGNNSNGFGGGMGNGMMGGGMMGGGMGVGMGGGMMGGMGSFGGSGGLGGGRNF